MQTRKPDLSECISSKKREMMPKNQYLSFRFMLFEIQQLSTSFLVHAVILKHSLVVGLGHHKPLSTLKIIQIISNFKKQLFCFIASYLACLRLLRGAAVQLVLEGVAGHSVQYIDYFHFNLENHLYTGFTLVQKKWL